MLSFYIRLKVCGFQAEGIVLGQLRPSISHNRAYLWVCGTDHRLLVKAAQAPEVCLSCSPCWEPAKLVPRKPGTTSPG